MRSAGRPTRPRSRVIGDGAPGRPRSELGPLDRRHRPENGGPILAEGLQALRGRRRRSGSSRRCARARSAGPLARSAVGGPQPLQDLLGVGQRQRALRRHLAGEGQPALEQLVVVARTGRPGPTRPPRRRRGSGPRRSARRPVGRPITRGRSVSTPPPPIWPKLRWPSPIRALRATRAKSQLSTSSSPPAAVTPLTSATTGTGSVAQASEDPVDVGHEAGEGHRVPLQLDVTLEVAAGAEGPPAPVTSTQHRSLWCERSSMVASSTPNISQSMAFRRSGRDRVSTAAAREVPASPPPAPAAAPS